jgi:hypothetical protein
MLLRRLTRFAAGLLACALLGCRSSTGTAEPLLRFDVVAASPERSAVYAVRAERTPEGVVVRGGFFVGLPDRALSARVVRVGAAASLLEVSAVRRQAPGGPPLASHYDYEAALPADRAQHLTVVHRRAGGPGADTVFNGRVF